MTAESPTVDAVQDEAKTEKVRRRPGLTTIAVALLTAVAFVPTILVFSKRPADEAAQALQQQAPSTISVTAPEEAANPIQRSTTSDPPLAEIAPADTPPAVPFSAQTFAHNVNALTADGATEPATAIRPVANAPEPQERSATDEVGAEAPAQYDESTSEVPTEASADPEREQAWWRLANAGPSAAGRKYYIVIGSLRDPRRAHALADQHEGWQPTIVKAEVQGQTRNRVVVGPFHWSDFQTAIARIVSTGISDAWPLPADSDSVPQTLATLALEDRPEAPFDPLLSR